VSATEEILRFAQDDRAWMGLTRVGFFAGHWMIVEAGVEWSGVGPLAGAFHPLPPTWTFPEKTYPCKGGWGQSVSPQQLGGGDPSLRSG